MLGHDLGHAYGMRAADVMRSARDLELVVEADQRRRVVAPFGRHLDGRRVA
jgi:hypothetical protein